MQEETTSLGVPCITLRENTERPITVTHGTNQLLKRDAVALHAALDDVFLGSWSPAGASPEGWDGRSALRLASHLTDWLARRA